MAWPSADALHGQRVREGGGAPAGAVGGGAAGGAVARLGPGLHQRVHLGWGEGRFFIAAIVEAFLLLLFLLLLLLLFFLNFIL